MNKNIIQFIVDENGDYKSIPVGRVKATSNLTTRIQLVTPITASVAVNYVIYDSKDIKKKQYLIPTGDLGSAVVDPNNPNYQEVAGWKVYEADIYAPILSVISRFRTGKVGMSFEFVQQVPNALCTRFVDYFGFDKDLPETANSGDYFICEDYNFWLNDKLYNKGDILVWYNEKWNNGGILPKGSTETVDISVDPAISYPAEEVDETAFGNAIGEMADDVADLIAITSSLNETLGNKQDKVDVNLNTTSKAVVGAINELKTQDDTLNANKLDKNFNLLVERTFAQLSDWVAIRSNDTTLKMSLETLRNYLVQGLVGLSFELVDELPPTGVQGVIYLVPVIENIVHEPTFEDLPSTGVENTIYIVDADNSRWQWSGSEYEPYDLGYEEFVWLEELGKYELIGTTRIDLSGYATQTWVTSNFVTKTQLAGGTTGQVLTKDSDDDGDYSWKEMDIPEISVNGISYLRDPDKTYLVVKIPTDLDEFTLLTGTTGSPNYTIEWGDGSSETVTTTGEIYHTYNSSGMYLITISGSFTNGIVVGTSANVNKNKMIEVYGGSNYSTSFGNNAFYYCTNLTTADFPNATSIDNSAFRSCSNLTTANFPRVKSVGSNAFYGCTNLTTADFPRVTSVGGNYAFRSCSNLTTANFPSATSVGGGAFEGCTNLTTANFPSATSVGGGAFSGCSNLTTANFPNATSVSSNAFNGCTNLTTANFPNVTSINNSAFQGCINLKDLTIGNVTATSIGTIFSSVKLDNLTISGTITDTDITRIKTFFTNNGGTFSQSYEIKHGLQIEKTPTLDNDVVRKIDLDAVKNLIPTQVNRYFTEDTQTLFSKSFRVMQEEKPTGAIANIDLTVTATTQATAQVLSRFTTADAITEERNFPAQNTEINIQANKVGGNQNIMIFARGYIMDEFGDETLLSTSNIATIVTAVKNYNLLLPTPEYTAPAGSRAVIEILAYRVSGSGTHTVRISVDDDTMSKWSYDLALGNITPDADKISYNNTVSGLVAENVQDAIDELALNGGGGSYVPNMLKDPDKTYLVVRIPTDNDEFKLLTGTDGSPNYTIEWGDGSSDNITDTSSPTHTYSKAGMYLITISDNFTNGIVVGPGADPNKDKMIEVYGGTNYPTSIGYGAFGNCTNLTTVTFPNVTSIGIHAFSFCSNLTTATFPKVTDVDNYAFQYCPNLVTANFPNATSIGDSAFLNCTNLVTATFPNAISIDSTAFRDCTSLTTVTFPIVTSIGSYAFYDCINLTIANIPNATSIGVSAFRYCTSLKELTLGNVTTTDTGIRFENVKLVNLTIAQDVDTNDIDRIKQFYADNSGTFTGTQITSL